MWLKFESFKFFIIYVGMYICVYVIYLSKASSMLQKEWCIVYCSKQFSDIHRTGSAWTKRKQTIIV
jgi:hypothetical protein